MRDFIFITGASGIGKSTLAKGLLNHYQTTCIEQNMVPEFISRDGSEPMTGALEELTCWETLVAMLMCFHRLGYKNIIASDLDDLRTADIPIVFKGTDFITIKLVCSDLQQLQQQMRNRPDGGLIDFESQQRMNEKTEAEARSSTKLKSTLPESPSAKCWSRPSESLKRRLPAWITNTKSRPRNCFIPGFLQTD